MRTERLLKLIRLLELELSELKIMLNSSPKNTRIYDVDFTVRTLNCLRSAGIEYVSEIYDLGKRKLLKIPNFGKASFYKMNEDLINHGFKPVK